MAAPETDDSKTLDAGSRGELPPRVGEELTIEADGDTRRSRLRARVDVLIARIDRRTQRLRRLSAPVDLTWELFVRFRARNGSVLVGHLAYRLFVWLAPLMLVLAGLSGMAVSEFDIVQYSDEVGISEEAAGDVLAQAERGRVTALVLGIPALALATWGLIRGAHYAYAQAWSMPIRSRRHVARDVGVVMLAALGVAVVSLIIAAIQRQGPLLAVGGWLLSVVLIGSGLWFLCLALPHRAAHVLDLLPGPLLGAFAISCVQLFLGVYMPSRVESASALYGSIGVAIAVLFQMFLIAYVLAFVPFVNSVWVDRRAIIDSRPWHEEGARLPWWVDTTRVTARLRTLRDRLRRHPQEAQ